MPKDYARYASKSKKKSPKEALGDFLVWSFVVIVIAGGLFLLHKNHFFTRFFPHKATVVEAKAQPQKSFPAPQEADVKFAFYNDLAHMQVHSSTPPALVEQRKSPVELGEKTTKNAYILQFGVYGDETKANEARISFLLSGADPEMVKIGVQYRLQQGPYKTQAAAKTLQKKLQRRGIETTIQPFYF